MPYIPFDKAAYTSRIKECVCAAIHRLRKVLSGHTRHCFEITWARNDTRITWFGRSNQIQELNVMLSVREHEVSLAAYVAHQANTFFPKQIDTNVEVAFDIVLIGEALRKTTECSRHFVSFRDDHFNRYNSIQYAIFLYFLSVALYKNGQIQDADRIFLLNKALSGIDLFYAIEMPEVFFLSHTTGIVFTKARYGERCVFHQGCTVGRDMDKRPTLGNSVVMYPNSSILGACSIGDNTVIAPGVQVINMDTPGNCIVFSGRPKPIIRKITSVYADRFLLSF